MPANKTFWKDHIWRELRKVAAQDRMVLPPVGTIEQHGPPPPLSIDCFPSRGIKPRVDHL